MMKFGLISSLLLFGALSGCKKNPPPDAVAATPAVTPTPVESSSTPATVQPEQPQKPKVDLRVLSNKVNDAVALLTLGTPASAERALVILKEVIAEDNGIAKAHFNKAVAHHQLNQLGAARMSYDNALDKDKTFAPAWLALGILQDMSGDSSRAIAQYRKGLEYSSESIDLHVALIGALRRQGRLEEAIQSAKDALKFNANSLEIYNELGMVYVTKGDLGMARFVYLKAFGQVEGAKNNAAIRCQLGRVLYLQGDTFQAERELLASYKLDGSYFPTLVYLAEAHLNNRAFLKAIPLLEAATAQQPKHHGVLMNLGMAYRGVDRFEEASKSYQSALKIDGSNPDPYMNLGILYGDYLKDYDKAVDSFQQYIAKGGAERPVAEEYIASVEKERAQAVKKKAQIEERKKREKEREERQKLLRDADKKAGDVKTDDPWGGEPSKEDTPPPAPEETDSPWE